MRLALMTEPQQGLSYDQLVALVRHAEAVGFEAFFRSDHYGSFPGRPDKPTTDAWATLAGLARETSRIRLGTLVSPVTFRIPGSFAKVVTTVDEMSGGRIEIGVGAGWNNEEHAGLGIPFPAVGERFDMLEEELRILHGLWKEPDGWSHEGEHWRVDGAIFHPKPAQRPHPPIILGGKGTPRSLRLAARWADEYNVNGLDPDETRLAGEALRTACGEAGRDSDEVVYSAMVGICVGASEAEFRERLGGMLDLFGFDRQEAEAWIGSRQPYYLLGSVERVVARIREYERAGVQRIMLQDWLPTDLEMVTLLAREVLPNA